MQDCKCFVNIIKDILGDSEYCKLLEEISNENKEKVDMVDYYDVVLNNYCFLILMLGFSKKVDLNSYKLKANNIEIEINSQNFARKYKKYIKIVENEKFNNFRKLL